MVTSEWGLSPQFEKGIMPEDLLSNRHGHQVHFWDLRARCNVQTIDLAASHQMALEIRPAHDPVKEYEFRGGCRRYHESRGIDVDVVARGRQIP